MSKVLIGLNSYNDLKTLRECLPVLERLRKELPADVVILDTAWNDAVRDFVTERFPHFTYTRHPEGNVGYGRSYNEIWREAASHDYFLVVTSDVLLDVAAVKTFVRRMDKDPSLTMVAGKLYHWDLARNRKTQRIDSLGIVAERRHHFYDRGCGEEDQGQYDAELEHFFGISGAVFLFRSAAIQRLGRQPAGLFDERMWMYKEDIDLAYRLRSLGEKIVLYPEVWGWHGRTVANREGQSLRKLARADREKRDYARFHSYKNHLLLLKNNYRWDYGLGVFLRVLGYELGKVLYVFFRSPKTFFAGLHTLLFVPGRRSPRRVSTEELLSHFD